MKPDPLATFERLASQAREEASPPTEVADRVLATLCAHPSVASLYEPEYAIVGVGSLIAACAAVVIFAVGVSNDSLLLFSQPFLTVLQ